LSLKVRSAVIPKSVREIWRPVLDVVPDKIFLEQVAEPKASFIHTVYGKVKVCVRSAPSGVAVLAADEPVGATPVCIGLPAGRSVRMSLQAAMQQLDFDVEVLPTPADVLVYRCRLEGPPSCTLVDPASLLTTEQ
jgi:hypothetical protein